MDEVLRLKAIYVEAKNAFVDAVNANATVDAQKKLFRELHEKATAAFNSVETCITKSDLLGANQGDLWAQDIARTAVDTLEHVAYRYQRLWENADRLGLSRPMPGRNAFYATQSSAKVYLPDEAAVLEKQFEKIGLPTAGFKRPGQPKRDDMKVPHWFPVVGVIAGLLTLLFFMAIAGASLFGFQVPSGGRFPVVVVMALGLALSGSFLGGTAAASGNIPLPGVRENPIRFTVAGGVAIFVIVLALGYLFYAREEVATGPEYDVLRSTSNELSAAARGADVRLDSGSGLDRADIRLGPFGSDTVVLLEAVNTASDATAGGTVTVTIRCGDEQLAQNQAKGTGEISSSASALIRIHPNKQLHIIAEGSNSHANSKQLTLTAYRREKSK